VCPIASRLHDFGICIPYCIVNSDNAHLFIPVTNTTNKPLSLPEHCQLVTLQLADSYTVAGVLSSSSPASSEPVNKTLPPELLNKLISDDLDDQDFRQQGASLLQQFANVFDAATSFQALGTAVNVSHSIELLPGSQPLRQ